MTKYFSFTLLTCCLTAMLGAADTSADKAERITKKGFGLPERKGMDAHHLELLKVGWYYNWGDSTKLTTPAQFVPMVYSGHRDPPKSKEKVLLGFNEPDHAKQADMTPAEALEKWPALVAKSQMLVAPALAGNPLKSEWLAAFLKSDPKVDAIALHWYKGADSAKFIKDLEEIHAHFKKPIWVTEFAPQTAADSAESPTKFTQAKVNAFIEETTAFMEKTPWVQRYAWHHSGVGTSALFTKDGQLSETGKAYAAVKK
ncbi:MAG: glycosyl hydrolase [Verrucomicrobia bacterium]|nr:glycosyl hydrolase [Verrucomicrobiota bacterium]